MSALGQEQTCTPQNGMSALPQKADMCGATGHVCFGPKTDINHKSAATCPFKREPRVPLTGPQGDDEKYVPCQLYPPLEQRYPQEVGGRHHRSSRIRPRRSARVQAVAVADCANPLPPYP